MHGVTESIYSGSVIVPLADVQHIEKWGKNSIPGIMVVTSHTKWNFEHDIWENAIWISDPEAITFRSAWCRYRSELEADTLMDLSPSKSDIMAMHDRTMAALRSPQDTQLSEQVQWALTELQRKEVLSGCTSYVQRKLQVGFNRAANILEELERAGWITEPDDTGLRQWKRSPQEGAGS